MLPQLTKGTFMLFEAGVEIEGKICFSRWKSNFKPVNFSPGSGAFVAFYFQSLSMHCSTIPELRHLLLHHIEQHKTILSFCTSDILLIKSSTLDWVGFVFMTASFDFFLAWKYLNVWRWSCKNYEQIINRIWRWNLLL